MGTTLTCANGAWGPCSVTPKAADTCDSGNDDTCDGTANQGCVCINGTTGTCGAKLGGKGSCAAGTTTCIGGAWGPCSVVLRRRRGHMRRRQRRYLRRNRQPRGALASTERRGPAGAKLGAKGSCAAGGTTTCLGGVWGACGTSPAAFDGCVVGNADDMCTGVAVMDAVTERRALSCPNPASAGLPNPASYTTNADGTVTDNVTGLTWATPVYYDGPAQAAAACATGAWHLPTVLELFSLVDYTATPAPRINQKYFSGTPSSVFATSSPYQGSSNFWSVDFSDGSIGNTSPSNGCAVFASLLQSVIRRATRSRRAELRSGRRPQV